ncbi:MAG: hypothetical protein HY079_06185 [Elusimicrobia bacterium]|nr:hypothetical protein [Elusimicrobiota bacterium]
MPKPLVILALSLAASPAAAEVCAEQAARVRVLSQRVEVHARLQDEHAGAAKALSCEKPAVPEAAAHCASLAQVRKLNDAELEAAKAEFGKALAAEEGCLASAPKETPAEPVPPADAGRCGALKKAHDRLKAEVPAWLLPAADYPAGGGRWSGVLETLKLVRKELAAARCPEKP